MTQKTKRLLRAQADRAHMRRLHMIRLVCFMVLIAGLLSIQLIAGFQSVVAQRRAVLAYATNISVNALFDATNQARASQGLGSLVFHSKLSNGAQAKANDMIAKNYWSHNAPDGTQPWQFFTNAGYRYTKAGENLAYGFDTSAQVIDAWMNSPGHRANVLGAYVDVGFGIANGPDYQGTENTVVVAFYAVQYVAPAPTPQPAPAAPSAPQKTTPTPTPAPQPATKPVPAPTPTPAPAPPETPKQEVPKPVPQKQSTTKTAEQSPQTAKKVTNLDTALTGNAGWAVYASLGLIGVTSIGFAGTHVRLVRRGWKVSEHFILIHPALDTAVLAAAAAVTLSSAAGFIK